MSGAIDAHQHYWVMGQNDCSWPPPELAAIHGDRLPADLEPQLAAAGIEGTILVQSQPSDRDTDFLLDLAEETPSVRGVVGWIDLRHPDAPSRIAALARRPRLVGLRPMLQDLADDWVLDARCRPALEAMAAHDLRFDALVRPRHLSSMAMLADRMPALRIVIDHGAKPDIAGGVREPWASDIAALAERPQIWCKLSGLVTEAAVGWSIDDLRFYTEHLLAIFGSERLIWGSDWPVMNLATNYGRWRAVTDALLSDLDDAARAAVMGGNARRFYGIA